MKTGLTRYGSTLLAVPALRKDGTRISIEFTIALLESDIGVVIGAAAIIREVTARWDEEQTFKKRLEECESQGDQKE
jgi:hypothetical protein